MTHPGRTSAEVAAPNGGTPGHVLLIEDEPNIATAIAFLLGRAGWHVSTHSDGTSAVAAVERHRPDVVVLDVMLPGRSGFDILAAVREGPLARLPVLMLTAKGQAKDRERAEALGVTAFMTKPFSNAELVERVARLAARGRVA
ncbi:response regulator [Jannaschia sp. LMIT008]|uniref:response regulator transcription factor n=1 Tax=Jannaschia maritima TaxID=3032585 RepID=UPI00281265E1|nr:response regulator [Jannaschia sp. LMIT008]